MGTEGSTEFTVDVKDAIRNLGDLGKSWEKIVKSMQAAELTAVKYDKSGNKLAQTWKILDKQGKEYVVTLDNINKKTQSLNVKAKESIATEQKRIESMKKAEAAAKSQLATQKKLATQLDRKVSGGITKKQVSGLGASDKELQSFQVARAKLKELVQANKTSAGQIKRIATDIANHKIKVETGANRKIQQAILGVNTAMGKLGSTARSELAKHQAAQAKSNGLLKKFEISWKSVGKLVASRIISSAISRIFTSIRQGVTDVVAFQKSIAQIQTIDVANLGYDTWAKQLRIISDEFGIPIVNQATAAYQALSNQIVQGAETFSVLASANK
ncbi:hypothetical protein DRO61_12100, partial [Candidatus Bathyarchaeota archaeon]